MFVSLSLITVFFVLIHSLFTRKFKFRYKYNRFFINLHEYGIRSQDSFPVGLISWAASLLVQDFCHCLFCHKTFAFQFSTCISWKMRSIRLYYEDTRKLTKINLGEFKIRNVAKSAGLLQALLFISLFLSKGLRIFTRTPVTVQVLGQYTIKAAHTTDV